MKMRKMIYGVIEMKSNKVMATFGNRKNAEIKAEELRKANPQGDYRIGIKWFSI